MTQYLTTIKHVPEKVKAKPKTKTILYSAAQYDSQLPPLM